MAEVPKQITKDHILSALYNIEQWCRYVRAVLDKSEAKIIVDRGDIPGGGDIGPPAEIWDCPGDFGRVWDCPGEYAEGDECEERDKKEKEKKEKKEKKKKKKPKKKKK